MTQDAHWRERIPRRHSPLDIKTCNGAVGPCRSTQGGIFSGLYKVIYKNRFGSKKAKGIVSIRSCSEKDENFNIMAMHLVI